MATARDLVRAITSVPAGKITRDIARLPLVAEADQLLAALPEAELVDITGNVTLPVTLARGSSRHAWSLGPAEQFVLQAVITGRQVQSVFEIGTFNGSTTRLLAEALPVGGRVTTLDLPASAFDASQSPTNFSGSMIGQAYRDSAAVGKIEQIQASSLEFDAAPFAARYDLVLVDGGHEYEHGVADTKTALRLLARGGVILWDDFSPYWHGLVRGICQEMRGRRLTRLAGTSFGVYVDDGPQC